MRRRWGPSKVSGTSDNSPTEIVENSTTQLERSRAEAKLAQEL